MDGKIRLASIHELKEIFIKEYTEYIKLLKNIELYYQKLQLNWFKFHLFYEPNKNDDFAYYKEVKDKKKNGKKSRSYCSYKAIEEDLKVIKQKEKQNNCYYFKTFRKSFILYTLRDITNSVELYLNIKIESMNKLKKNVLTDINNFCREEIKKIIFLIILCELKLNNLLISQRKTDDNNKLNTKIIKNIIECCKKVIHEITKNLIPHFLLFNIFSSPNYFNYQFNYFDNFIESIEK
ncbi:conserved Plasmodium protein, unknown function [Plasmodium gallinaceum]|uniref:Uncharacterized protein n=1 Tax=Plasmodium gallinaceum TaxID=5849 RepID=A0A1J1GLR1_PLAGA|nr:conserved Plasmodium protein, unknown function [Plasmodium gallinaceum]CRG93368.1 conserved Plasmodium protein, unknown function [Plasmodium gallinaceum]